MFINPMKYAFLRLVGISLLSVLITAGALFLLRFIGLSQHHAPLDHPLLKKYNQFSFLEFIPTAQNPTPQNSHSLLSLNLWISKDLKLFLFNQSGQISEKKYIFNSTEDELKSHGVLSLEQFFMKNKNSDVLLNVYEQDPAKLFTLKALITKYNLNEKIILQSPYPNTLSYLRKENPLWLFGSHLSLQTQLMFLSALYIEPIAKITADFIITPMTFHQVPLLNPRIAAELKRRNIRLIIKKNAASNIIPDWLQPDGFLLSL